MVKKRCMGIGDWGGRYSSYSSTRGIPSLFVFDCYLMVNHTRQSPSTSSEPSTSIMIISSPSIFYEQRLIPHQSHRPKVAFHQNLPSSASSFPSSIPLRKPTNIHLESPSPPPFRFTIHHCHLPSLLFFKERHLIFTQASRLTHKPAAYKANNEISPHLPPRRLPPHHPQAVEASCAAW